MTDVIQIIRQRVESYTSLGIARMLSSKTSFITQEYLSRFGHFEGCTEAEIAELMQLQGVSYLPTVYHDYLLKLGKRNGGMIGLLTSEQLKTIKQSAIQSIQLEEIPESLPENVFVFHQNWATYYLFFPIQKGLDDPPVFRFHEEIDHFEQVSDHLSEWLIAYLDCVEANDDTWL